METNNNNCKWLEQSLSYKPDTPLLKWSKKFKGIELIVCTNGSIFYKSNPDNEIPQNVNPKGYKYITIKTKNVL